MTTLKIGIASYEDMEARTMATARGDLKPNTTDPKVWFTSPESFAKPLPTRSRDAMQAEESRMAAWHAAIRTGDEQLDRGEGLAYNTEALDDITRSAISAMHSGQPMDPDALP